MYISGTWGEDFKPPVSHQVVLILHISVQTQHHVDWSITMSSVAFWDQGIPVKFYSCAPFNYEPSPQWTVRGAICPPLPSGRLAQGLHTAGAHSGKLVE